MVRTLTAYTEEIDDIEAAVAEVLAQLDLPANRLANSVGLLTCYSEFIDSGVVAALCEALPFDVVGATTMGNAVPGGLGQLALTLAVLTSDDVFFQAFCTESLVDNFNKALDDGYPPARAALGREPVFALVYAPLIFNIGGDIIIEKMKEASREMPLFGTLALDHTSDYSGARVIYNGRGHRERLAGVLVAGNISPVFFMASVAEEKVLRQKAVITASKDNLLIAVNNMPALDYLEELGLVTKGNVEGIKGIPFIIDYNDGTKPVVRSAFGLTPDGDLVCGGSTPVNTTLGFGAIDYDDVVRTTREMVEGALASGKRDGLLMFSCIGRNISLNFDTLAELQTVEDTVAGAVPYQMTYSGGEICPVYKEDGSSVNRFHNNTIVACAF